MLNIHINQFDELFPILVIWTIITLNFPKLAELVINSPQGFANYLDRYISHREIKEYISMPSNEIRSKNVLRYMPLYDLMVDDPSLVEFYKILFNYVRYDTWRRLANETSILQEPSRQRIEIYNNNKSIIINIRPSLNNDQSRMFATELDKTRNILGEKLERVINNTKLFL
jgi:hypothetical protein